MGAENSILEGCLWDDELICPAEFQWRLSPVTKSDGTEAVVFQPRNQERKDAELLKKCAKTLQRLRHPNIIRFLGSGSSTKDFWMATEPVSPILSSLTEITSEELSVGIQDCLQALEFMHSKLGVCHNNICPSSVFVSKDGGWKLGGLEHSCKFQEATPEYLDSRRVFRDESSLAPEEKAGQQMTDLAMGHARDVFAIGALVDALTDRIVEKDGLLSELEQQITVCVSIDPSQRPTVSTLLKLPIFSSEFVNIVTFLRNVTLKTDVEKKEFFSDLIPKLECLPESVIARRMVVPLLSRFVLLEDVAQDKVLPHILTPRRDSDSSVKNEAESHESLLSDSLYQQFVIPHLCNIFRVHDYHIRMVLLKYFSSYVHLFSREQLEEDIFLQILLGVRDSNDKLVAASLRALADLVSILGGDYVIGGSRKTFFFHGLPKQVTMEMPPSLNGSLNVGTVLSKAHPPLLKDLAAGGRNTSAPVSVSAEERERKMKERQQKRDEARLRKEERRKKLKEKLAQENEESAQKTKGKSLDAENQAMPTIEEVASLSKDKTDDGISDEVIASKERNNELADTEEKNADEASDWSDWEDPDGSISKEIEDELRQMSSSEATPLDNKVQTSPSPYRSGAPPSPPPITLDWSDMPEADRTSALVSPKSLTAMSLQSQQSGDKLSIGHDLITGSSSPLSDPAKGTETRGTSSAKINNKSLKLKSSTSATSKAASKPRMAKKTEDLGLGYDIKSIDIKTNSSLESDFFADMKPNISMPSAKTDPILSLMESSDPSKGLEKPTSSESKKTVKSSLFAMDTATAATEDSTGWGADDDLDWGNDNF